MGFGQCESQQVGGGGRPPFCSLTKAQAAEANKRRDVETEKLECEMQETQIICPFYGQFASVLKDDSIVVGKEISYPLFLQMNQSQLILCTMILHDYIR